MSETAAATDPTHPPSASGALVDLDARAKRFVCEIAKGTRKGKAAELAGYASGKSAGPQATRLLARHEIQVALAVLRGEVPLAKPLSAFEANVAKLEQHAHAVDLELATETRVSRAEVLETMRKIMLGLETETRYTKTGEAFEVRPPAAARVAAAARISAMEGYDAPTRVGGKIEHEHAHSGTVEVFSKEELKQMPPEQLKRRIAELRERLN
jgi:hypothetical protein